VRYIKQYYDNGDYLYALAHSIQRYWKERGSTPERLVFSFHGIPQKYARKGDPYPEQCRLTAQETARRLQLGDQEWICAFQSRFGPDEWVKPYTTDTLRDLAHQGVKRVDVVCPAFSADCLETLEEIAVQNREVFLHEGGMEFGYIPALNADETFIDALSKLVMKHLSGWI
jgi:ferrochelatase